MVPTSFSEANWVLDPPEDLDSETCESLSVMKAETEGGYPIIISCWKLTKEELEWINQTGRVWLTVMGETMPPVELRAACPAQPQEMDEE